MSDLIHTAATELSVLVPSIWSRSYYDVLLSKNVFKMLLDTSHQGEIAAVGDTVKISTFPEFSAATELSESAANEADAVTVTQQSLVIDKQIVKDLIVTDKALMQSLPAVDKLKELAIYSIEKKIQALIIAAIVPSAAAPDHQIGYSSGTTLALADILNAKELLDTQNVPMADRHMVLGAAQLNDLFNITSLTSNDFVAKGLIDTGEVKNPILGFMPEFTTAGGANVAYFFHRSFMTYAAQKGMEVKEFDLGVVGKRGIRVNCSTLIGLKQLDNKRVVTIS